MNRTRTQYWYKYPRMRAKRNRVMPLKDVTPAASFNFSGGTGDPEFIEEQLAVGFNSGIVCQLSTDNAAMVLGGIFIELNQGSYTIKAGRLFEFDPATGLTPKFMIYPGDLVAVDIGSQDGDNPQVFNLVLTNLTTNTTISEFTVNCVPPVFPSPF